MELCVAELLGSSDHTKEFECFKCGCLKEDVIFPERITRMREEIRKLERKVSNISLYSLYLFKILFLFQIEDSKSILEDFYKEDSEVDFACGRCYCTHRINQMTGDAKRYFNFNHEIFIALAKRKVARLHSNVAYMEKMLTDNPNFADMEKIITEYKKSD